MIKGSNEKGFTFIELLTALFICSVIIAIIYPILSLITDRLYQSESSFQAAMIAQSVMEQLKNGEIELKEQSFSEMRNNKTYFIHIELSPYDINISNVKVEVRWSTLYATESSFRLIRLFSQP